MEHPEKKARRDKVKRHPPHLKGKQIGLYYAKLSKERKNSKGGTSKKDFFLKCVIYSIHNRNFTIQNTSLVNRLDQSY